MRVYCSKSPKQPDTKDDSSDSQNTELCKLTIGLYSVVQPLTIAV